MSELNIFNGPQTASGSYTTGTYSVPSGTTSSDWSQLRRGGAGGEPTGPIGIDFTALLESLQCHKYRATT